MVFINGVKANCDDILRLNFDIIHKNIHFTARKDWFGNQHVITFN